jgi:hypothetical protein
MSVKARRERERILIRGRDGDREREDEERESECEWLINRREREEREKGIKWGERKPRICRILCGSEFMAVGVTNKIFTHFRLLNLRNVNILLL